MKVISFIKRSKAEIDEYYALSVKNGENIPGKFRIYCDYYKSKIDHLCSVSEYFAYRFWN